MADMSNPNFISVTVFRKPTLTLRHTSSVRLARTHWHSFTRWQHW